MPIALFLDTAIALLKRYKVLILVLPLLLALGVQSCRLNRTQGKLDKAKATIAQMEVASKAARAAQIALNQANQELSQRIAEDAQARHVETRRAVSDAVAAYAARNRVQDYCNRGGPGIAALPSGPSTPDSPERDEVLAVPREDFEALAKDALRGAEARAFLIDQINAGLAIVYPEPSLSATAPNQ